MNGCPDERVSWSDVPRMGAAQEVKSPLSGEGPSWIDKGRSVWAGGLDGVSGWERVFYVLGFVLPLLGSSAIWNSSASVAEKWFGVIGLWALIFATITYVLVKLRFQRKYKKFD